MAWSSLWVLIGLVGLLWGGDRFVVGASATARNLGISPLLIGLTIVAFGTSAPEIFVSILASLKGNPGIAVGNAFGSNIANVGLVIGVTALIKPIEIHSATLRREYPLLFLVMLVVAVLLMDHSIGRIDGIILLSGQLLVIIWLINLGRQQRRDECLAAEYAEDIPQHMSFVRALFWLAFGGVMLLGSSELLVLGATDIARWLGISDVIIGLTVVAVGTSLPELMASVIGVLKGEPDIAVGNVLGSNVFNLLSVLGIPGLIHPAKYSSSLIFRDFVFALFLVLLMYILSYGHKSPKSINRFAGIILLSVYVVYLIVLA